MENDYKYEFLLHLVRTGAIKFKESGHYSINIADAMRTGADAIRVANAYAIHIKELGIKFDYIHGAAYKGIPLAILVAIQLSELKINKRWGYSRKEKKQHGEEGVIVGKLQDNDTVLIVDDTITTGVESWLKLPVHKSIKPVGILIAVDCEESSDKKILEKYQLKLYSILRITEVLELLHEIEK